jgi:hypothetical protein
VVPSPTVNSPDSYLHNSSRHEILLLQRDYSNEVKIDSRNYKEKVVLSWEEIMVEKERKRLILKREWKGCPCSMLRIDLASDHQINICRFYLGIQQASSSLSQTCFQTLVVEAIFLVSKSKDLTGVSPPVVYIIELFAEPCHAA